jgi:hypothetical protein
MILWQRQRVVPVISPSRSQDPQSSPRRPAVLYCNIACSPCGFNQGAGPWRRSKQTDQSRRRSFLRKPQAFKPLITSQQTRCGRSMLPRGYCQAHDTKLAAVLFKALYGCQGRRRCAS